MKNDYILFLEKLYKGNPFSLMSFGDGEWSFIFRERSGSGSREFYSEKAKKNLIQALSVCVKSENCYLSTMKHPGGYPTLMKESHILLKKINYDKKIFGAHIFYYALKSGSLAPLIAFLKRKRVVMIGANHLRKIHEVIPYIDFVEVPSKGATEEVDAIEKKILNLKERGEVYCFSAGIVSNILIGKFHGVLDATLLDLGYVWNPFTGRDWRKDLLKLDKTTLEKNLNLKTYEEYEKIFNIK